MQNIEKKRLMKKRNSGNLINNAQIKQKILSEVFIEKLDALIFHIFSELFNIYGAILSASFDIELVFSPGIKHIEYLEKVRYVLYILKFMLIFNYIGGTFF